MWFDPTHVEAVRDSFPEWMALVFAFLSFLGSVWFVAPVVVGAFWFVDRHRFGPWVATVVGGYAVMAGSKAAFATPRPDVGPAIVPETLPVAVAVVYAPLVEVSTTSFPSGHAIAGTIVWTMLASETDVGTRRQRLVAAAVVIGLIGLSRIGNGLHYPIDVVAGIAVATGYLAVVLAIREWVRPRGLETTAAFATSAVLATLALVPSPDPAAAALVGGCLGAVAVWRYARPTAEPWPLTASVLGRVAVALGALAVFSLLTVVADTHVVWFGVGLAAGVAVVGLPVVVRADGSRSTRAATR